MILFPITAVRGFLSTYTTFISQKLSLSLSLVLLSTSLGPNAFLYTGEHLDPSIATAGACLFICLFVYYTVYNAR